LGLLASELASGYGEVARANNAMVGSKQEALVK
jgi:hypothetical protein